MASNTIDFTGKTFWQKKKELIYQIIAKLTNFDPATSTCNWPTSGMQLHVPNAMVICFMNRVDFDIVCSKLVGKKNPEEVLMIIVNPNNK